MTKFYMCFSRCVIILLLLTSTNAWSQDKVITGKVTSSDDGSPLPGVNVVEKGTTNGSISNADGTYSLSVASPEDATLVFSFVGFKTQEIPVGMQTSISTALVSDVTALSEVVIVGYGTQEKSDVTGVVSTVDSRSFNKGAIVSADQLLTGKVAGVQIVPSSGEPGISSNIRVRGGASIGASSEPLYVIDGVPIDNTGTMAGRNPLNFLNPGDIETFTVLKDASAAAIYGSRAANGVIIITTKKGEAGRVSVTYDGWVSVGKIARKLDVFNAEEYKELISLKAPAKFSLLNDSETDWQNEIYRTAIGQNHALTISGGNVNSKYRFSMGRQEQGGIIKTSLTERTNLSLNFSQNLLNDDLIISLSIKGAKTMDRFSPGVVGNAIAFAPTQPVYDPTSPYGGYYEWKNTEGAYDLLATNNPVALLDLTNDLGEVVRSVGNVQFDYKLNWLPGLRANVNLGYDLNRGSRKTFSPGSLFSASSVSGIVSIQNPARTSQLLEAYLNYAREFKNIESKIDLTTGYSWQQFDRESYSYTAQQLSSDIYGVNDPSQGNQILLFNPGVMTNRLISFFGRLNYSVKDKYLLTATVRKDGSTRFGPLNKWGVFPSAAFAWRAIDENFLNGLKNVFSDLKVRVGYGVTGNQEIPDFTYLPTYLASTSTAQYQFGNTFVSTIRPSGFDENLQWEETASFNIGLDYGILDGRINGSLEYYKKDTDKLLFTRTVPPGSNLTDRVLSNIGKMSNSGVEVVIDAIILSKSDLRWNVGINAAFNKNEILALDGSDLPTFKGYETGGITGGTGNNVQILKVGQPINSFYLYQHKTDAAGNPLADLDNNEDGVINLADMYEDTNGDGSVNIDDRRSFKQAAPRMIVGLTSQVNYKNFDFSFTMRANLGNYVYNNVASNNAFYNLANQTKPNNMLTSVLKTNFTTPQYFSDYYVENASFLRMDNLSLGYTPKFADDKLKLRVYGTVQNAFIITNYSGLDPETGINGIDNNLYPRSRTFIMGVSVGL